MKHAATQDLYGYWRSLCRGRTAPERNDIDPAAIRKVLADTFMIDVDDARPSARTYPIRLSGTRMNALFDRELKGESLLDLWAEQDRSDLAALIGAVLDDARPAVAGSVGAPIGRSSLGLELILLPLRHKGRTHVRLLGCLSPQSVPSWLGLISIDRLTLTSQRMIDPAAFDDAQNEPHAFGRSSMARRPRRRAHFTIHEGGLSAESQDEDRISAM